jgi:hypothetical protein
VFQEEPDYPGKVIARFAVDAPTTPVLVADTLTELRMWMVPGLRSLDGIETASRLERLSLSSGAITDLSPLAALPNLRAVDITMAGGVRITDVNDLR